jgi:hypothetical protein
VRDASERAGLADELTIALLRNFTAQNRTVSINRNPNNYAPTLFAETPEAEAAGLTAKEFKLAIERLLNPNRSVLENREFRKGSETRYRLVLKGAGQGPSVRGEQQRG